VKKKFSTILCASLLAMTIALSAARDDNQKEPSLWTRATLYMQQLYEYYFPSKPATSEKAARKKKKSRRTSKKKKKAKKDKRKKEVPTDEDEAVMEHLIERVETDLSTVRVVDSHQKRKKERKHVHCAQAN